MADIANISLYLTTATQLSVANTNEYPIPGAGNPAVALVHRIFYAPVGLSYTREFAGQIEFMSWNDYSVYTGLGVATPFAFGTQPTKVAIKPDRTKISFLPGSAGSGDTITVQYAPLPTVGTSVAPLLNETDAIVLPDDCSSAIVYWALWMLWAKGSEIAAAKMYRDLYFEEVKEIKMRYSQSSVQDGISITNTSPYIDDRMGMAGSF